MPPAKSDTRRPVTPPADYSTKIKATATATECVMLLSEHGAMGVGLEFDADRQPSGLSFRIDTGRWGVREYRLPVHFEGVRKQLEAAAEAGTISRSGHSIAWYATPEHAKDVAWRQIRHWLTAQIAMIEAGIWELPEVMLPWMLSDSGGATVYRALDETALRALGSGS